MSSYPPPDAQARSLRPNHPSTTDIALEASPAKDGVAAPAADCPRCGGRLINPESLGWCMRCGYCRSLEEAGPRDPRQPLPQSGRASRTGLVEFFFVLGRLPDWFWGLLVGVAVVVACSLPPMLSLPAGSLTRCVWCTIQIVVGVLMILVAQAWAVMLLAPDDDRLGFKDTLISGRLWFLAARRLPETRVQVSLAVWGLAAILSAVLLIGSLSHWFTYLPRSTPVQLPTLEEVTGDGGGAAR